MISDNYNISAINKIKKLFYSEKLYEYLSTKMHLGHSPIEIQDRIITILSNNKQVAPSDLNFLVDNRKIERSQKFQNIITYLSNCINCSYYKKNDYKSYINETEEYIKNNDWNELTNKELRNIEFICISNGLYRIAYTIRKIQKDNFLNSYKNHMISSKNRVGFFWSLLSSNMDVNKIYSILEKDYNYFSREMQLLIKKSYPITEKNSNNNSLKRRNQNDIIFANMIEGKKVAIIGPSNSELDITEINTKYDVVIRLTYRGQDSYDKEINPSLKRISYYNSEASRKILNMDKVFFVDLDFIVFKSIEHKFQRILFKNNKCRSVFPAEMIFYNAQPNMLQVVLFDLLYFNPSEIKIFNFNFFLATKAYKEGYKIEGTGHDEKLKLWKSFAVHNIISQYEFSKLLYDRSIIKADDEGSYVLSLGLDNYIDKFQAIYS